MPLSRSLSSNGLTGSLPTELGRLTALTELCVPTLAVDVVDGM